METELAARESAFSGLLEQTDLRNATVKLAVIVDQIADKESELENAINILAYGKSQLELLKQSKNAKNASRGIMLL